MLAAALLLSLYMYLAVEAVARLLILMSWFVALLFTAGLVGFVEVAVLSGAMTAGYLIAARLLAARGLLPSFAFEVIVAGEQQGRGQHRRVCIMPISYVEWTLALVATAIVQLVVWWIPHRSLDEHLRWDRHYTYTPMLAAALLLSLYMYPAVNSRATNQDMRMRSRATASTARYM